MVPGDASSVVSVNPAKPLISVCIPMYNNGATIERCLRSILEQEGVEFEIVVVDDDSSAEARLISASSANCRRNPGVNCRWLTSSRTLPGRRRSHRQFQPIWPGGQDDIFTR